MGANIKKQFKASLPIIIQASICCLLWGTAIPTLKISYKLLNIPASDIFNRIVLAGLRFLIAGMLIGLYLLVREKKMTFVKGGQWKTVLIFGLLNTTLQYLFFYIGVGNTGAIKGVLIDTSKPLIIVIFAHFLTRDDKISSNKILGLIIGFIGILLANLESVVGGGLDLQMTWMGEGALIISSLVYGFAVIYGKKAMAVIPSVILNMHQMVIGALILLVVGLIGGNGYHLVFNVQAIMLLIYSGFISAVAFVLWFQLIHKYGASHVAIFIFLIPIFGSIISSTLFPSEHMSWNLLGSLILMCISIFLVNKSSKKIVPIIVN